MEASRVGCYVQNIFAAAIFYADDMAILSPSVKGLQKLLDLCSSYCQEWDVCLNPRKTKNLFFGKKCENLARLSLDDKVIEWVDTCVYLGVTLKSGKRFGCSILERVKKFYRCANSILRIDGRSDDLIMLRLLETHCVPILSYAIEVIFVSDRNERRKLRVAYNSIYRKIFSYRYHESVSELQGQLQRPTWEQLIEKKMYCLSSKS